MALHYKNKKTEDMLFSLEEESPKAVQIFGHDSEIMAEAVQNPLLQKFDIIDINMGCPAKKIVSNGDGSALLKDMELARQIIKKCVASTTKPITVKFRIGTDSDNICAVEFAKMCESAGASAITVHGRTVKQGYGGKVDLDIIREVKRSVKIPVFANGDCNSHEDYVKILRETGADGVMVGRASLGSPEIFKEILTGKECKVDKLKQILFHYDKMLEFYPEKFVVLHMRSHLAKYLSGKLDDNAILLNLLRLDKYDNIRQMLINSINIK